MIFVDELDVYLRSFHYWINFDVYLESFSFSDEIRAWKSYLDDNNNIFKQIEISAETFGFKHDFGKARGMYGEREIETRRINFYLSFDGLKIYPRLLYSEGYLPKPEDFEAHRYFFTYLPKVLMPIFQKQGTDSWKITLSQHWTIGSHRYIKDKKEHLIAYNVSVPVNLRTIIEEELHSLGENVHGTTKTEDVLTSLRSKDPNLEKEIELSLNHILSAEEKRFRDFGDLIQKEKAPEIRILRAFCNLFEKTIIGNRK